MQGTLALRYCGVVWRDGARPKGPCSSIPLDSKDFEELCGLKSGMWELGVAWTNQDKPPRHHQSTKSKDQQKPQLACLSVGGATSWACKDFRRPCLTVLIPKGQPKYIRSSYQNLEIRAYC